MEVKRMNSKTTAGLAMSGAILVLAGCGGSGDGGGTVGANPPASNASPGGIWRGNESVSGLQVVGIVDESGNFHFIRGDNVQYTGTATVSGTSLQGSIDGIVPLGFVFADGSAHGTGTITATVQARKSITAATQFKTDNGTSNSGTLNLTFDALYNRPSSLATLSGNFTNTANNVVVTVGTNGSLFSQDAKTGCVLNGTAGVSNASYNAYKIQFDYASCTGSAAALNGVQFSGLGTLDNTVAPERILVGATGKSGNVEYSVVIQLNRT
jgi:hypothetical protein